MNIFNKQPFLIGEIGFNFLDIAKKEGLSELDAAKLMIKEADGCGIDGVNFYAYSASDKFAFDKNDFKSLKEFCDEIGIMFLATPLDFKAVDDLTDLVDVFIIQSQDLTNIPFIKYVARKNKSVILSTGAATIREIKDAVDAIEDVSLVDVAILHSVLSYHTDFEDAHLLMIKDLKSHFPNYEIGYSDYIEADEHMIILTTAFNYGAVILNKPFTLDKTLTTNTHRCAMDSADVAKFRENLVFLSKINGYSNKQPLVCESSARKELRKSIVAKEDIKKGDEITDVNVDFKRPGTGISPAELESILGKTAVCDIKKDDFITLDKIK